MMIYFDFEYWIRIVLFVLLAVGSTLFLVWFFTAFLTARSGE